MVIGHIWPTAVIPWSTRVRRGSFPSPAAYRRLLDRPKPRLCCRHHRGDVQLHWRGTDLPETCHCVKGLSEKITDSSYCDNFMTSSTAAQRNYSTVSVPQKNPFFLDGDRCGSNPDELHSSFEHWSCAAHHNSLPQHTCVGRRTLPATFWQGCKLQNLDRGEDSGRRPPGAADTKGRLLGMDSYLLIAYRIVKQRRLRPVQVCLYLCFRCKLSTRLFSVGGTENVGP